MASPPVFHVRPTSEGRWEVGRVGSPRMLYDDKDAAITAAVELARTGASGVVRIYAVDGDVESERRYTSADDPSRMSGG